MAARTPLAVPESGVTLADAPPPEPRPPARGEFASPSSREVVFVARTNGRDVTLRAFLRVGVWTTLQETGAHSFVLRESWGRLGERRARRLSRTEDQVLAGVVARLRPDADGGLSFVVDVAQARTGPKRPVGIYHGERIALGDPHRHGYRFAGRAPPGWTGPVARWGDLTCTLGGETDAPPPNAVRFRAGKEDGFVAGARPRAETFVETWAPAEPVHVELDGVERMDFRLQRTRRASGFRRDRTAYGAEFEFAD